MTSSPTRRTLLRLAAAGAVPMLAGCSESLSGSDNEPSDPDAGQNSYGILLTNETEATHTVYVEVALPFGDETAFEETVSIDGGESREWEQVITENEEWAITGELQGGDTNDPLRSDNLWITPGSEDAPAVENVQVLVNHVGGSDGPTALVVTTGGE